MNLVQLNSKILMNMHLELETTYAQAKDVWPLPDVCEASRYIDRDSATKELDGLVVVDHDERCLQGYGTPYAALSSIKFSQYDLQRRIIMVRLTRQDRQPSSLARLLLGIQIGGNIVAQQTMNCEVFISKKRRQWECQWQLMLLMVCLFERSKGAPFKVERLTTPTRTFGLISRVASPIRRAN